MAAQDAELKLKVSLDTAYFKQQLTALGTEATGYRLPINIKFARESLIKQQLLLGNALKKTTYDVKIESNTLDVLVEKVDRFRKNLAGLKDEKIELGVSAEATSISQKEARKIRRELRNGIVSNGGKILIPATITPAITNADVTAFKRAVTDKLSGITVKVKAELESASVAGGAKSPEQIKADVAKGLEEIARIGAERMSGGGVTEAARREQLRTAISGVGITEAKRIAKELGVGGASKYRAGNVSELIDKIVADASIEAVKRYLDPQAMMRNPDRSGLNKVLDTFARGLFNMLGMDPASLRREMAQRRALPGVNFPATVPPRNITIGPSSTGRALPPGAIPSALPGTAFGAQRYLPTGLSDEMQRIMRGAAYAFVDSVKQQVRSVRIGLAASQQPLLGAGRVAGLLPAGVGRAPSVYSTGSVREETRAEMMARREREARVRSALRGMDVMGGGAGRPPASYSQAYRSARPLSAIVPYAAGGAIVPQPSMAGGGAVPLGGGGGRFGGAGGFGGFGRALGNVPNLPGTGVIRELGSEFAFATKQVLLFGQAYKLLAILQDFPAQIGAAVGQLQSFRNTLGAITPTAEEARASNELILDLMNRYNVPLQSAREGFTKLYASMAPAGFSGDEIRELFTGITKAAATFGMSADKVDRVNYAFAQMASKGQVMSEELKGQLGDVLPGAMALFAKAAGFEGPEAIQDFSAALEDGAYKGEAMVALLKNVGIVMNQEFGPGAEGAARTFQGVINRMQNSMTLLYESFEPIAVEFLNTVVAPMTDGIKALSDGFTAFFTGAAAKTAGGSSFASQLTQLKPAFDGIRQNLQQLAPLFTTFTEVAISLGKVLLQVAGNPFVGYLLRVYAAVLPLTAAIKILNLQAIIPMIASLVRAIPAFVAFNAAKLRLISTNKALQLAMQLTGNTSTVTAGKIRLVTAALATLAAPAILLGIGALIERFMMLKGAVDGVRQSTQQMLQSISSMANTGAVKDLRNVAATTQQQISTFEGLSPFVSGGAVGPQRKLTPQAAAKMQELGLGSFVSKDILGKPYINDFVNASKIIEERLKGLRKQATSVQEKLPLAEKVAADLAKQAQQAQAVQPITMDGGDGKGTKTAKEKKERESQVPLLELELATTKQLFELERDILTAKLGGNDLEVIRLEGLQKQLQINEEIAKVNLEKDIPSEERLLQIERLRKQSEGERLRTAFEIEQKIQEVYSGISDAVTKIAQDSANELADKQSYERLVSEGVLPSVAKITVETNRQFAIEAQKLSVLETQIKDQIALLSAKEKISDEDQKQLDILKERLGIIQGGQSDLPGLAQETIQARISGEQPPSGRVMALEEIEAMRKELEKLASWEYQAVQGAQAIGAALGEAMTTGVAGMISGTATAKEVFASFLQSVGQALSQAASQMIATYIAIGIAKMFAGLNGGSGFKFSGQGPVGFPSALNPMGGADVAGNFAPNLMFANGGIAPGGFQAFANGGVVSGPTLGLVGEGRYNEAIVPLPDGKSIPVQLAGGRSARDIMGDNRPGSPQGTMLNMSFETTKINGVEYVSREQLEQAMAETRRASIAGGAQRGMSMTLDKIQQNPSVRSRLGMR